MVDEAPVSFHPTQRAYIMELAEIYAKECSAASLEKASENAKMVLHNGHDKKNSDLFYYQIGADNLKISKGSIKNSSNIKLL